VVVGGLKFTVSAPGAWTLNFVGNRLNFSEDPAYAGSQFKIEITDVDGGQFKYADYVIGYTANPIVVNGYTPGLNINGMTMGDTSISGNYQHPDHSKYAWRYSSGGMGGEVTTSKITIFDEPVIGDTQNPYSTLWLDNIVVDTDLVPPNVAPTFVGATTSISASQNSTALDVSALLHVSDTDLGQTLFWTQASAPAHGTLNFSGAAAASGGTDIGSGGMITYRPNAGFAGVDTFTVQVSDGTATTTRTITVNVLDTTAPTTTVSSSTFSADSGLSATDFVTRVAAQTISGTLSANLTADETVQVSLNNGNTWATAIASVGSNTWSLAGVVLSGSNTLLVKVTDIAGNDGAIYSQAYVLDTTAPLLTITSDRSVLKAGEPATITFTFSEDPGANFTWDGSVGDIVVSGGTLSALSGSGTTRTAVFMPAAGVDFGTASITVAAGSYTDAAGNGGGAGVTPSLTFDNAAPAVAITSGSWTDDPTPVITGTAETDTTIRLSIGGAIYVTTAAQGVWSIDLGVATPDLGSLSLDTNGDNLISVTATDTAGNVSATVTKTLKVDINDLPTGVVTISGVAVKGEILTVSHTLADADGLGLISYQWQADGADIAGATGATFILAEAQVGKAITVRASYTDGGGHAESVTSPATALVMFLPDVVVTPNANGGADITITDPSQLTAALGTSGIDQVLYGGSGTVILPDNIENLTLTGGNANGVGNDLRNVVRGSAGDNALQGMAGNDWINSGDGRDSIDGGVGSDFIFGGASNDLIDGGSGNDKLQGAAGNDQIWGGAGKDGVYGGNGDDRLSGGVGHDRVNGGLGHDWISGGSGNDTLYGGSGRDRFVFDTKPNTISNVDKILDFKPSADSILLDDAIFAELGKGSDKGVAMRQEMFVSASVAQDAQDRIIYDRDTGSLYYDRDGTGSVAQVRFEQGHHPPGHKYRR
jgi:hypothetical protein